MDTSDTDLLASRLAARFNLAASLSRRRLARLAAATVATVLTARITDGLSGTVALAEPIDYAWVAAKVATPLRLAEDGSNVHWLPRGTLLRTAVGAKG